MYEALWNVGNRIRRLLGKRAVTRRCCRNLENLSEFVSESPDFGYRKCRVCGSRHFELIIDPGHMGMEGMGVG